MDKDEYFQKLSQAAIPENQSEKPSSPAEEDGLKKIHTFKSDIADAIKKDSLSYSKIASAEAERQKRMQGLVVPPKKKIKNFFLITCAILLLLVGIGGVFISILFSSKNKSPSEIFVSQPENTFSSDQVTNISFTLLDKQSILKAVAIEKKKELSRGEVKLAQLTLSTDSGTSSQLSTATLLDIFAPNLSGITARSLKEGYDFGFYGGKEDKSMFIIFHTDFYDDIYGGMLAWEKYINRDLEGFMVNLKSKIVINSVQATSSASSTGTTTSSSTATSTETSTSTTIIPLNFQFQDEVVGNKDIRVLKDIEGNTIFLYCFLDQQTLVFSTNEDALIEIENRNISAKRIQ